MNSSPPPPTRETSSIASNDAKLTTVDTTAQTDLNDDNSTASSGHGTTQGVSGATSDGNATISVSTTAEATTEMDHFKVLGDGIAFCLPFTAYEGGRDTLKCSVVGPNRGRYCLLFAVLNFRGRA